MPPGIARNCWTTAGSCHATGRNARRPRRPASAILGPVSDLPFRLPSTRATVLAAALDRERKIDRALEALGPLAGREVVARRRRAPRRSARLAAAGARIDERRIRCSATTRGRSPTDSADAIVSAWSAFRGVEPDELAAADRILRPGRPPARRPRLRPRRRLAPARRPAGVRHLEPARRTVPDERLPGPGDPLLLDVRHDRGCPGLPGRGVRRRRSRPRRGPEAAAAVVQRRGLPPDPGRERSRRRGRRCGGERRPGGSARPVDLDRRRPDELDPDRLDPDRRAGDALEDGPVHRLDIVDHPGHA